MKPLLYILLVLAFNGGAFAQDNAREQLKQYVTDLQKNPVDDALREKIIKLALTITPKPAPPPEADELSGRAKYLLKNATSESDFAAAAKAFSNASDLVPWEPEYYFNQGVAFEKSKQFEKAILAFKWYLMAAPDADDAKAVRERIGGLKAASEKSSEAVTTAERERQKNGGLQQLRSLVEGKRYNGYFCSSPEAGRKGQDVGCNWEQYHGQNWFMSPFYSVQPLYYFEFRGDEAYLIDPGVAESYRDGRERMVHVRSNGASLGDLIWESHPFSATGSSSTWRVMPFVDYQADFSRFVVGPYVQSKDEPSSNPNRLFHYYMYKAQ